MKAYSLVGQDGNAFFLMGYTQSAMKDAWRKARNDGDEAGIEEFGIEGRSRVITEAKSGDYNHLLRVLDDAIYRVNEYLGLEEED